eukprot:CAMPEP_0116574544 /NCGR_PEP_ID=MMETSP0397-20121206/19453_1 /TAXON_ID=216820 /ORGANISM="Cyclophora tenuis, Strain ECT3854" /LENGTH=162 /DNA_ID=CAMNT_0004103321 /DNA_START=548 /DNA_END=1032 /DNA_ORIENTATION=-
MENSTAYSSSIMSNENPSTENQPLLSFIFTTIASILLLHQIWILTQKFKKQQTKAAPSVITPPHVRTFIPHIGSALELRTKTILDFIRGHAAALNSPIFTATIMGKKCVFLADSRMVPMVFSSRNDALDSDALQIHVLSNVLGYKHQDAVDILDRTLPISHR